MRNKLRKQQAEEIKKPLQQQKQGGNQKGKFGDNDEENMELIMLQFAAMERGQNFDELLAN